MKPINKELNTIKAIINIDLIQSPSFALMKLTLMNLETQIKEMQERINWYEKQLINAYRYENGDMECKDEDWNNSYGCELEEQFEYYEDESESE